jgi:hypothetical protein
MAQTLSTVATSVEGALLRKGNRVFALLGKATSSGIVPFRRDDVANSWAVTAEFGCIRLERLTGDEEVTGLEIFLTTPFSYEYGIAGATGVPELTRAVFGLLPSELEQLVSAMRRGSFPVLGFSRGDLKCDISACIIPGCWPHVVVSNLALYGNVISVETMLRVLLSSMPQGNLTVRFPGLQNMVKHILRLIVIQRRGIPYCKEMLDLAPATVLAGK